jgi:hypothetical protein
VARKFADKGLYRTFEGGSVLLKVVAPPQNIICTVTPRYDRYAEEEYLVDRCGLKGVTAVQRYWQLEYSALIAGNGKPDAKAITHKDAVAADGTRSDG